MKSEATKEKRPGGLGAQPQKRDGTLSIGYSNYNTKWHKTQAPLSSLIDQAVDKITRNDNLAWHYEQLAADHRRQAAGHRRILAELSKLVPGGAR